MSTRPANKENIMSLADQLIWGMQTYGNGFETMSSRLFWVDDFLGKQLLDPWRSVGDAGGGAAVIDAETGGIVRIDTSAVVGEDWLIDWNNIRSLHVSKEVSMEVRAKLNQDTHLEAYFSLRFDALNEVRFYCFENFGGADTWEISCVDAGAGGLLDTGIALDTDYHVFLIVCHIHGANHVHFYIDEVETDNSPITANIPDDAADYLDPTLFLLTRTTAERSMDIDYVVIRQNR